MHTHLCWCQALFCLAKVLFLAESDMEKSLGVSGEFKSMSSPIDVQCLCMDLSILNSSPGPGTREELGKRWMDEWLMDCVPITLLRVTQGEADAGATMT